MPWLIVILAITIFLPILFFLTIPITSFGEILALIFVFLFVLFLSLILTFLCISIAEQSPNTVATEPVKIIAPKELAIYIDENENEKIIIYKENSSTAYKKINSKEDGNCTIIPISHGPERIEVYEPKEWKSSLRTFLYGPPSFKYYIIYKLVD